MSVLEFPPSESYKSGQEVSRVRVILLDGGKEGRLGIFNIAVQ